MRYDEIWDADAQPDFGAPEPAPFWERFQHVPQMIRDAGQAVVNAGQAAANGLQQVQDPVSEDDARRRLLMERSRQQYERMFGRPNPAGPSLAWEGNQDAVDYLLQRVGKARRGY